MEDKPLIEEFLEETEFRVESLEQAIIEFENHPKKECLESIFIDIHSIKGICGFYNFPQLEKICHQSEELIKIVQKDLTKVESSHTELLINTIDNIKTIIDHISFSHNEPDNVSPKFLDALNNTLEEFSKQSKEQEEKKPVRTKKPLSELQKKALASLNKVSEATNKIAIAASNPDGTKINQKVDSVKVEIDTINKLSGLIEETKLMKGAAYQSN